MTRDEGISINCGCSTAGACVEHKARNTLVSEVADVMSEADEVALAKAIERLGAVEVAVGYYAYRFEKSPGWYVAPSSALEILTRALAGQAQKTRKAKALGIWAAGNYTVAMPLWWSPEQRFAWRSVDAEGNASEASTDKTYAQHITHLGGGRVERITADLATGEEVPC
jgi:hypothetical protein